MFKAFVLTMVFAASNGGGGITTHEYNDYSECQEAARSFVKHTKNLTGVTYVNAWCNAKTLPKEQSIITFN